MISIFCLCIVKYAVCLYLLNAAFWLVKYYIDFRRWKADGVVFNGNNSFSVTGDAIAGFKNRKLQRTYFYRSHWCLKEMGARKLPPITGYLMFGRPRLSINSAEVLTDVYMHKNSLVTKSDRSLKFFGHFIKTGLFFTQTSDPLFPERRKALSGAFFKQKLIGMTKIIKEATREQIRRLQQVADRKFDLVAFTMELQSRIIISASVGSAHADTRVDMESESGPTENMTLAEAFTQGFSVSMKRLYKPHNLLFPMFIEYAYMPYCRRYVRNIAKLRQLIQKMVDDRRKNPTDQDDLLSILLNTEFYSVDNDATIIDEVLTFFFAGMKTIQISTTNLVYQVVKNKHIREKLMSEIRPAVDDAASGNIIESLTYETVMEFEYLNQCYCEALRREPPAGITFPHTVSQDTTFGNVRIKAGQIF